MEHLYVDNILLRANTVEEALHKMSRSVWEYENRVVSPDPTATDESIDVARKCRVIKAPTISLPKFHGNQEEFSEFWAIFETLVHNSTEISQIEKIVLLKESLKGPAEKVIRGIQPVPKNYPWMVETITKRYSYQPINPNSSKLSKSKNQHLKKRKL
ncbi:hypothetical protein OSTOST_25370, partial [Ostertagia ostertagi]